MSAAEADRFISDLKADPNRFEELTDLKDDPEAVYAKVRDLGYDATIDEIKESFKEFLAEEIGEEELAKIAGGLSDGEYIAAVVGGGLGLGVVLTGAAVAAGAAAAI